MKKNRLLRIMKNSRFFRIIKDVGVRIIEDDVTALGAQMTYYLILAVFPFTFFLITIVSYTSITSDQALANLGGYLPSGIYDTIRQEIDYVLGARSKSLLSFGMIVSLWIASNAMEALTKGLNKAYDKIETRPFWKVKIVSILFTFGLAIVFLISFVLVVIGGVIARGVFDYFEVAESIRNFTSVLRYIVPVITMFCVFLIVYYIVPNRRLTFKKAIPGSIFSTVLWIALSQLFSYYMTVFSGNYSKTYGSIGGIILVLVWMYWSSIIILIGGELNATLYFKKFKKVRKIRIKRENEDSELNVAYIKKKNTRKK